MSEPLTDVLQSPAVGVLLQLESDGFEVAVVGDRLRLKPISKLTPMMRADIERYRDELLVLVRIYDAGVQDRRLVFAQQLARPGPSVPPLLFRPGVPYVAARCYSCGDPLPHPRHGRCWRCGLAARLACGAPIPPTIALAHDEAKSA